MSESRGSKTAKVVGFLLLKPAFTSKNLSSLGLVAVFFAIYVFATGGDAATLLPNVKPGDGMFGGISVPSASQDGEPAEAAAAAAAPQDAALAVTPQPVLAASSSSLPVAVPAAPAAAPAALPTQPSQPLEGDELKQDGSSARSADGNTAASDDFADLAARLKRK